MIEITNTVPSPKQEAWDVVMGKMEVGQSFSVKNGEEQDVRHTAWRYFHRTDKDTGERVSKKRFTVQRDPEDEKNFRCWREPDVIEEEVV